MKLWFSLVLNDVGGDYVGYEDEQELATDALVFMVVAVNHSWKISVAYFLINGLKGKGKGVKYILKLSK